MESGTSIYDICINVDASSPICASDGPWVIMSLDVWYIRPSPTLTLTVNGTPDPTLQSAKIIIKGSDGSKKSIIIRKTGQISVQNEL